MFVRKGKSASSETELFNSSVSRAPSASVRAYMVVREGMVDDVDMVDQSVDCLPPACFPTSPSGVARVG